ncbi:MAG: SIR2 family NAD-dependent protein deacylase [Spirochaetota bacterium]
MAANRTQFHRLVELIKGSSKALIFTGAGISTGSGIPDYRGPRGLWKTRSPVYYTDFLNSEQERARYWAQKLEVWDRFKNARPNNAHKAAVELEHAGKLLMVVTQNTDGLHRRAGTSLSHLVEMHGTVLETECQSCHRRDNPEPYYQQFRKTGKAPTCTCGGYMKPATISFGQNLRQSDLERAFDAAANTDLVISLGSTLSVTPAASVPLEAASRGVPYVIINQGPTEHDSMPEVTLRFEGDVVEIFPDAVRTAL